MDQLEQRILLILWMMIYMIMMMTTTLSIPVSHATRSAQVCAAFTTASNITKYRFFKRHSLNSSPAPAPARLVSSISNCFDLDMKTVANHMLYRIRQCNQIPDTLQLVDFVVDGKLVGKVRENLVSRLISASDSCFVLDEGAQCLQLTSSLKDSKSRTDAVMKVMENLRSDGTIQGWRDELLPVVTSFYDEDPVFLIERAAAPHLGTIQYGVHINGFVKDGGGVNNSLKLWMARRSKTKSKYPGMLDHIVAGGQPFGITPSENVIKECEEEAGIPRNLAQNAVPVGAVSYAYSESDGQVNRSVLFCYDIELPSEFEPKAVDGEVDEFFLRDLDKVMKLMDPECDDPIKPNCYLVIIDFFLRNGILTPETPGYLDILRELRSGDCV